MWTWCHIVLAKGEKEEEKCCLQKRTGENCPWELLTNKESSKQTNRQTNNYESQTKKKNKQIDGQTEQKQSDYNTIIVL